VLRDHDFHPGEPTVRIFRTSSPGVLRPDDSVAISDAAYGRVVLRHFAFAEHWFTVNVTTGLSGRVAESGEGDSRFAFNCDGRIRPGAPGISSSHAPDLNVLTLRR
jgi:hypothetical protein